MNDSLVSKHLQYLQYIEKEK